MRSFRLYIIGFVLLCIMISCGKKNDIVLVDPSDNLRIDSIVASKKTLIVWEESYITAYAIGDSLTYKWKTNHGSMLSVDSKTVKYWGCPSCIGHNVVECFISNRYGTVSDTIMINVKP